MRRLMPDEVDGGLLLRLMRILQEERARRRALEGRARMQAARVEELSRVSVCQQGMLVAVAGTMREAREGKTGGGVNEHR